MSIAFLNNFYLNNDCECDHGDFEICSTGEVEVCPFFFLSP